MNAYRTVPSLCSLGMWILVCAQVTIIDGGGAPSREGIRDSAFDPEDLPVAAAGADCAKAGTDRQHLERLHLVWNRHQPVHAAKTHQDVQEKYEYIVHYPEGFNELEESKTTGTDKWRGSADGWTWEKVQTQSQLYDFVHVSYLCGIRILCIILEFHYINSITRGDEQYLHHTVAHVQSAL